MTWSPSNQGPELLLEEQATSTAVTQWIESSCLVYNESNHNNENLMITVAAYEPALDQLSQDAITSNDNSQPREVNARQWNHTQC